MIRWPLQCLCDLLPLPLLLDDLDLLRYDDRLPLESDLRLDLDLLYRYELLEPDLLLDLDRDRDLLFLDDLCDRRLDLDLDLLECLLSLRDFDLDLERFELLCLVFRSR